jgi:3-sulfinopropanoyl-CoA desulfinase
MTFVKERKPFRRPIAEFGGLQGMLADMAVALNAARLSLHQAALSADPFPNWLLAAQAKIMVSETANTVTNQALQLFGARGYSRDYPLERMVRDARMFTVAGGTAQVLRTLVASRILGTRIPQTRNGYLEAVGRRSRIAGRGRATGISGADRRHDRT